MSFKPNPLTPEKFIQAAGQQEDQDKPWLPGGVSLDKPRVFNLRLPAELYYLLVWLALRTDHRSMHSLCLAALEEKAQQLIPIALEVEKLLSKHR